MVHSLARPTQLGLSSEQWISEANKVGFIMPSRSWERLMLSWWAHWRDTDTNTRTRLAFIIPTHTQHKEISPFSATQSLKPWSPFQCYSGVVEKKDSSVALSVWFSTYQVYQAPQTLIHHSNAVRGHNHCMQAAKQLFKLLQGKNTIN